MTKDTMITLVIFLGFFMHCSPTEQYNNDAVNAHPTGFVKDNQYVELSKKLVEAVREDKNASEIIEKLAKVSQDDLMKALNHDATKKAFFINVYNGFVQYILKENPEKFEDRGAFFSAQQITIAGEELSLDDIEHGIIRGSKVKWSLGLIQDPFANDFEKTFRVDKTDGRIHFALNCGAKSCPYIAIYDATQIDEQLDIIAHQFLNSSSTYQPAEDKVYVTSLFSWFRGDFGGLDGVVDYLRRYEVIPQEADPKLEFKEYDWTLELGNYTDLEVNPSKTPSSEGK